MYVFQFEGTYAIFSKIICDGFCVVALKIPIMEIFKKSKAKSIFKGHSRLLQSRGSIDHIMYDFTLVFHSNDGTAFISVIVSGI